MTVKPRSAELRDAEFVHNIKCELADCISGLEHQQLGLEVLKPVKRDRASSIKFIVQRQDGSVKSSVYGFERGEEGQIRITQARDAGKRHVRRHEEALWSQEPVARTVEAAVIECYEGKHIPMSIEWGPHPPSLGKLGRLG